MLETALSLNLRAKIFQLVRLLVTIFIDLHLFIMQ
jgi:hypothetical protein